MSFRKTFPQGYHQPRENIDAEAITLPDEVVKAVDASHMRITNPVQ